MSSWQRSLKFTIYAPEYCEDSSGVRALYRLCHLLNRIGHQASIFPFYGVQQANSRSSPWDTPVDSNNLGSNAVVVYPEITSGNPLKAERIVRWVLNYPGVVGGDQVFSGAELVMVWDKKMLGRVNRTTSCGLSEVNVLQVPVVDPTYIYPDSHVIKDTNSYFIYKGRTAYNRFHQHSRLPEQEHMICIDSTVRTQLCLGELLRRTKTLYCFDHATILFHEALIAQCEILQVHADGLIVDPRTCAAENRPCSEWETTSWPLPTFEQTYIQAWDDGNVIKPFVDLVANHWTL
jgi:hypothetical protein